MCPWATSILSSSSFLCYFMNLHTFPGISASSTIPVHHDSVCQLSLSPPRATFAPCSLCKPSFSGGKVELSSDGKFLACLYEWDVSFVDVEEGVVSKRLRADGAPGGEEEIVSHREQ